ncbi:MAG: NAD(P)H-hydrate dehydratase [Gammaproteobacteria bacterium]|nr:NAD(P)H-hydrate dehydratase [Gammaproteobacteria bacterium]
MQLYSRQQVYQLDQLAIQEDTQPSRQLMHKAATAAWRQIQSDFPECHDLLVLAGSGNNGGDAFAVALMALQAGYRVRLITMGDLERQSEESRFYRAQFETAGGNIQPWAGTLPEAGLIIDGLLGIGLNKSLAGDWQQLISAINQHPAPTVSIDIPSGLNADTGNPMPCAVEARLTITFIGRKLGCYIADGPDYCGEIRFADLGLSQSAREQIPPSCQTLQADNIELPAARRINSHKNDYGHVLVIGGDRTMSGAVSLAASAALRSGAGLVSLCLHPENYQVAASRQAELMVSTWADIELQLARASVVVIGPGLGQSAAASRLLQHIAATSLPLVVDADALTAAFVDSLQSTSVVLTPHPGEAARLLDMTSRELQQDRLQALQSLTGRWPFVSVLKGSGSLIGQPDQPPWLCLDGHPGMASAGMGDVLSGMIGGYLAQGLSPWQAARSAVLVHALAAQDFTHEQDANSLIASDVIAGIGRVVRRIHQQRGEMAC